jgi:hypothetical protein
MSTRSKVLAVAFGFLGAVLGASVHDIGLHLYADHQALHALLTLAIQNAQQAQQAPGAP